MVKEIKLYVEGGGKHSSKNATIKLQRGFDAFLKELKDLANSKNISFKIIPSGSIEDTYKKFDLSIRKSPQAFNLLLVDADKAVPIGETARVFLQREHKKWKLKTVKDEQCHLMVQMMEAWFIADVDSLKNYYGQGFNDKSIPKSANVETIDKMRVETGLKTATKDTTKGEYQKINHGGILLEKIDAKKVRRAAHFCEILFNVIAKEIG